MTTQMLFPDAPDEIGLIETDKTQANCWYLLLREYDKDMEVTALRVDETFGKAKGGHKRKNEKRSEMDELTLKKSQQRAKINARRKCFAIAVDRLLTLTFRENVTDLARAWAIFKCFIKHLRKKYPDFSYVVTPELQERGAIHFHLAIRGFHAVNSLRRSWLHACGTAGGNVDITSPRKHGKKSWNSCRIAQYLAKYITKSDITGFNRRRYASGGKIPKPILYRGFLPFNPCMGKVVRNLFRFFYDQETETYYENEEGYYPLIYAST